MTLEELLRQGKSFGQGASNSAASTVTGPVDMLAWLLRKGGVNVGDAPMGGEAWMRQKGLMATPENRLAGLLGEGAGLAAPIVAAAKAPEIAGGLLQMGRNLATPQTMNKQTGAIVYHGSPHKFDKFDSSKIGTGEGAQAYGHGLYLAESPTVAKSYQEALSSTAPAKRMVSQSAGDVDAALQAAQSSVDGYKTLIANGGGGDMRRAQSMLSIAQKRLEDVQRMKAGLPEETGSLYKVDLPDDAIARMLDWDKPLSQQPKNVKDALEKLKASNPSGYQKLIDAQLGGSVMDQAIGRDLYKSIGHDAFPSSGIPGIRYLDGGSRSAGAGSSNFVVFPGNEGLLKILERNGGKP